MTPLTNGRPAHMMQSPNARTIAHDDTSLGRSPNALNKSVQINGGGNSGLPSYKSQTQKKPLQMDNDSSSNQNYFRSINQNA